MGHNNCMLDKPGYMHTRAFTRPRARAHVRTSLSTLPPTQIRNIYCFSMATIIRERASLLRYTYIVCLVFLYRATLHFYYNQGRGVFTTRYKLNLETCFTYFRPYHLYSTKVTNIRILDLPDHQGTFRVCSGENL